MLRISFTWTAANKVHNNIIINNCQSRDWFLSCLLLFTILVRFFWKGFLCAWGNVFQIINFLLLPLLFCLENGNDLSFLHFVTFIARKTFFWHFRILCRWWIYYFFEISVIDLFVFFFWSVKPFDAGSFLCYVFILYSFFVISHSSQFLTTTLFEHIGNRFDLLVKRLNGFIFFFLVFFLCERRIFFFFFFVFIWNLCQLK